MEQEKIKSNKTWIILVILVAVVAAGSVIYFSRRGLSGDEYFYEKAVEAGDVSLCGKIKDPQRIYKCRTQAFFKLKEWGVTDIEGRPVLSVIFSSADLLEISLVSPEGMELTSISPERGGISLQLPLANTYTTPRAGTYSLRVENALESAINNVFAIELKGAELGIISRTGPDGSCSVEGPPNNLVKKCALGNLAITFGNSGDLPSYVAEIMLALGGKTKSEIVSPRAILPGKSSIVELRGMLFIDLAPGVHTLWIFAKDAAGVKILSYEMEVTLR